jgi:ABC-type sugar transport system ATPase subunit
MEGAGARTTSGEAPQGYQIMPEEPARNSSATPTPLLLRVNHVSKRFLSIQALDDISFDLRPGEVLAVAGENGAGKSTMMKILAGAIRPDAGEIALAGARFAPADPGDARALGISVIYQDVQLVPQLSVAANILLHELPTRRVQGFLRVLDKRALKRRAAALLRELEVDLAPDARVGELSAAAKQLVQIAKAFSANSRILIMDEPTASLEAHEVDKLFALIRQIKSQGTSVIFVSHRLDEVLSIADRITVFRDGKVVATRETKDLPPEELIRLIVGRELKTIFPKEEVAIGDEVLRTEQFRSLEIREDVSLQLNQGELLAVSGLLGSGASEMVKAIGGQKRPLRGHLVVRGKQVHVKDSLDSIAAGIGCVPEDRKTEGVLLNLSIESNVILPNLKKVTRLGFISRKRASRLVEPLMKALSIRAPSSRTPVKNLSGGNQQKVVLAKWLASNVSILALNEPTHGVDIGAKAEVHKLMGEFVKNGGSIVFASSELPEILGTADRVAIFHKGRLSGELNARRASQEEILSYAAGFAGEAGEGIREREQRS